MSILNVGTQVIDVVDDTHASGHVYCKGEIQVGDQKETVRTETRAGLVRAGEWTRVAIGYDRIELILEAQGVLDLLRGHHRQLVMRADPLRDARGVDL